MVSEKIVTVLASIALIGFNMILDTNKSTGITPKYLADTFGTCYT